MSQTILSAILALGLFIVVLGGASALFYVFLRSVGALNGIETNVDSDALCCYPPLC